MVTSLSRIRKLLFGISPRARSFDRLGFPAAASPVRPHLERILDYFVDGYHATLEDSRPEVLLPRLRAIPFEFVGFAHEGVALCLTAFDLLTPWKRDRWQTFRDGPGEHQSFLMHVGYGLALARLGRPAEVALRRLPDPGERWLAVDGYGFHEGFFHWRQYIEDRARPPRLTGFAARAFDQGLGRVLWFGCGAEIDRVVRTLSTFPGDRHADLWCGLGVACTYAGGVGEPELLALLAHAAPYVEHFRQGSVFAAVLRHRAGNVVPHTELACRTLSGLTVDEAVRMVDAARDGLPPDSPDSPVYEALRRRVQKRLASIKELHT